MSALASLRRPLAWLLIGVGTALTLVWVVGAVPGHPPRAGCHPVDGMLRGVYHVHPSGHDGRDRAGRVVDAAEAMCLDFVVSTNHAAQTTPLHGLAADASFTLLDGAEWTRSSAHHHGQLTGAERGFDDGYRVLNHPAWSSIASWDDLADEDRALARDGKLSLEILNVSRLLRTPPSWTTVAGGVVVGTGRPDTFLTALAVPGQAVTLWRTLQSELAPARLPAICGTDAHGGLTDYAEFFPSAILYLDADAVPDDIDDPRDAIAAGLKTGDLWCVNEHLGSPGRLRASLDGCTATATLAELPSDATAEWVVGDGERRPVIAGESLEVTDGPVHIEIWRDAWLGIRGSGPRLWALHALGAAQCPQ